MKDKETVIPIRIFTNEKQKIKVTTDSVSRIDRKEDYSKVFHEEIEMKLFYECRGLLLPLRLGFNHWTGEHSSPLRLDFLSLIWNLHPNNAFPLRGRGTAPAVDEVLEFNGWQKQTIS